MSEGALSLAERELEAIRDALRKCKRHYRCDLCTAIVFPHQFDEWQHNECGGLVREYVERLPILQATQRATPTVAAEIPPGAAAQRQADLETLECIVRYGREATPLVKRMLPHLLACAKLVEEHGETIGMCLRLQDWPKEASVKAAIEDLAELSSPAASTPAP